MVAEGRTPSGRNFGARTFVFQSGAGPRGGLRRPDPSGGKCRRVYRRTRPRRLPAVTPIPSRHRLFHTPAFHALVLCLLASRGLLPEVAHAGGGCSVVSLQNGVAESVTNDPATFRGIPDQSRWMAVAMRNVGGSDWNLEARGQLEGYPTCATGSLATSNQFGPDILAFDGHSIGPGTDYVIASTGNGSGFFGVIEYEQPSGAVQPNTVWTQISTGPNDFLIVREVQMFDGIPYSLRIKPSSGLSSLKLYVFAPANNGPGWRGGHEAALEAGLAANSENEIVYTPSEDGIYAIVIVNESGAIGTFDFAVSHCPFSANVLSEGVPSISGRSIIGRSSRRTRIRGRWSASAERKDFSTISTSHRGRGCRTVTPSARTAFWPRSSPGRASGS